MDKFIRSKARKATGFFIGQSFLLLVSSKPKVRDNLEYFSKEQQNGKNYRNLIF